MSQTCYESNIQVMTNHAPDDTQEMVKRAILLLQSHGQCGVLCFSNWFIRYILQLLQDIKAWVRAQYFTSKMHVTWVGELHPIHIDRRWRSGKIRGYDLTAPVCRVFVIKFWLCRTQVCRHILMAWAKSCTTWCFWICLVWKTCTMLLRDFSQCRITYLPKKPKSVAMILRQWSEKEI